MPGAFQSVATATSIVAGWPGRSAACAGPARASARDAAAIARTEGIVPDLQELPAVDEPPAREPRESRQPPDLDVHGVRVVLRMLVAVLPKPRAHVVLRRCPPALAAVDQQLVLSHRLLRRQPGCRRAAPPAPPRGAQAARGTASSSRSR